MWQFVCRCKKPFNLQSFRILPPSVGAAGQPARLGQTRGHPDSIHLGAGQCLSSCPCLWEHMLRALRLLWRVFFSGTDPNVANQRHYITVLAALMYVFPLFGMLCYLCIPEPVLWDGFHPSQLDQGTMHTTLSLSSCHSSQWSRDCPARHACQKKTPFICSQWKTQAAFKRTKSESWWNVRGRYTVFITFIAKFLQLWGLGEHVASAKLVPYINWCVYSSHLSYSVYLFSHKMQKTINYMTW